MVLPRVRYVFDKTRGRAGPRMISPRDFPALLPLLLEFLYYY